MLQLGRYWPEFCRRIDREDLITDERFATAEALMDNAPEAAEIVQTRSPAGRWPSGSHGSPAWKASGASRRIPGRWGKTRRCGPTE